MTVYSRANGREVYFDEKEQIWKYVDTNQMVGELDPCGVCGRKPQLILVNIKDETGKDDWELREIDDCIVPFVEALNNYGILTSHCCCGHENSVGTIILQDGRVFVLLEREEYERLSDEGVF